MVDSLARFHGSCIASGGIFVAQNETFIVKLEDGDDPEAITHLVSYFGFSNEGNASLFRKLRCRFFADPERWRQFASEFHFSVGPRFHGNMMALRAGRPAFFVVHDNRTAELVDTLGLPHTSMERIVHGFDPYRAYQDSVASFPVKHYKECFGRFVEFLELNGLSPKTALPEVES